MYTSILQNDMKHWLKHIMQLFLFLKSLDQAGQAENHFPLTCPLLFEKIPFLSYTNKDFVSFFYPLYNIPKTLNVLFFCFFLFRKYFFFIAFTFLYKLR